MASIMKHGTVTGVDLLAIWFYWTLNAGILRFLFRASSIRDLC